jgi:hypothetical protein
MKKIKNQGTNRKPHRILQAQANGLRSRIQGRRQVHRITEHQWGKYLTAVTAGGLPPARPKGGF